MFFIDLGLIGISFLASFIMLKLGFNIREALLPIDICMVLFLIVQSICVYNWSKEYNLENLHVEENGKLVKITAVNSNGRKCGHCGCDCPCDCECCQWRCCKAESNK